jgi:hypothetical protein
MRRILAKSDLMIEGGLLNEPGKPEDLIDRSYWQAGWVLTRSSRLYYVRGEIGLHGKMKGQKQFERV